ncbi:MAG TPA: DNA polymerase III subunit delta [Chloroflexi bacterium]|jgi:DNA polymerase-3 subunit delta|nr:DNA polymerase III subunit delta [Chloroflexota bacterium]
MAETAKPSLYLLRGDDSVRVKEILAGFQAGLGDPSMADLNTVHLNGEGLSFEELQADALTIPFLTERRLIIVENARQMFTKTLKENQKNYLDLFENLPQSSALVMLVEDQVIKKRGERNWEHLKSYEWVIKWLEKHADIAVVVDCTLPDEEDMPAWVLRKAKELGGAFRPDAAHLLASYVGNNTLQAGHEVEKLILYVGDSGIVEPDDVMLLTAHEQEGNIFSLTDALGERNAVKAMQEFQILTEKSDVMELSGMIHRHFRQLIQAREIIDEGGSVQQIEKELNVLNFIARKLYTQAQRFSLRKLLDVFAELLRIDEGIKTGGMPGQTAYELLIAELTR